MKKLFLLYSLLISLSISTFAGEGMWLPLLLSENEADMQAMGMKMTAEDIYSVNQSSLKDAILLFGSGCTGSMISEQGLLLTNHHCGRSLIQQRSTIDRDYLKNGFWAASQADELANPGLKVTFLVRMEDVTEQVLGGLGDIDENARQNLMNKRISELEASAVEGTHYEAEIKSFYYGNAYYLLVKEVFTDVRLVGAPPSSIGEYGGDTDNWVWPRHGGDFSLFRVYTGPDGKPADYSEENIPYKPRHHLPVSLKGVEEGDFTLVFGYPYRTQEYLPSYAVEQLMTIEDPLTIHLRDLRLEVYDREMRANDTIRLMYTSKASRISNGWKKYKGRLQGMQRNQTLASKQAEEAAFRAALEQNPEWQEQYGDILPAFETAYAKRAEYLTSVLFFNEGAYGIEAFRFCGSVLRKLDQTDGGEESQEALSRMGNNHFRGYKAYMDEEITVRIVTAYGDELSPDQQPSVIKILADQDPQGRVAYVENMFAQSVLTDSIRFREWVDSGNWQQLGEDPVFKLMTILQSVYVEALGEYRVINNEINELLKRYMQAQLTVSSDQTFYPDANQSLRVTYGNVQGMKARDGVRYRPYTTLDGAIAKYVPGDYDFDLPEKLIDLHAAKDYGRYGKDGELRVAFIASNHTSGGNSGSPVIDAEGRLIGLNFDRNWEGTMSDIDYDINQCRNISVDIRYVLFVVDKFAGAGHLVEEMTLVE